LREPIPPASVPPEGLTVSPALFQPLLCGEQHPICPPKNFLIQKNIINKQTRKMIGKIHQNPANGELDQNHIALPPFHAPPIYETNRKIHRFNCIDEIDVEKDTGAEKKDLKLGGPWAF
jgi:hypothetical protein